MHECIIARLRERIASAQSGAGRVLVALAGPPGSGKTTFSAKLAEALNVAAGRDVAAVLPMDGFHFENDRLSAMGLLNRKGAPETFDVAGLMQLITAVRRDSGPVSYPVFDRVADKVQADARLLPSDIRFVIVEGNYLLLQNGAWAALSDLFDITLMLRADPAHLRKRLVARWLDHGLTRAQAEARADGNDMVNAALVLEHSALPDLTLVTQPDDRITFETTENSTRHVG